MAPVVKAAVVDAVKAVATVARAVMAVDVRGGGPGTRETDLLDPAATVQAVDALVLAGGSAFGLDAAAGVVAGIGLVVHEMIYFNTDESMLRGAGAQFATVLRRITHRGQGAE